MDRSAHAARRQGPRRPEVSRSPALFRGSQHHVAGSSGKVRALEQRLETVLAIEPGRDIRGLFRCAGGHEWHGASRADVRLYRGARPCFGSWRKRGQNDQALGRSRGGFSTKIHLKVDLGGLPLAFHLTGGEASDSRNFEILLDLGPDIAPRAAITDKGYDAKANRDGARRRGICPVIPYKSNAIDRPAFFPKILYIQGTCPHRAGGRQAQALQTHRTTMRENRAKLRLLRGSRIRLHLGQIRPHGLTFFRLPSQGRSPIRSPKSRARGRCSCGRSRRRWQSSSPATPVARSRIVAGGSSATVVERQLPGSIQLACSRYHR